MKYCPVCDAKYDEEIIRFCTKDGSPLIDDEQPNFVQMPSESLDEPEDDPGEVTIIRRKPETSAAGNNEPEKQSERIVIPTSNEPAAAQNVRPRATQTYYAPPQPPNTTRTVALTIVGTLVILGFGAALFWFLQKESPANKNGNNNANLTNQNTNLNTNLKFDSNFNFNSSVNIPPTNLATNLKTPTPTPSPKPSPSASPSPSTSPTPRPSPSIRPSPSPTPRIGPRPPTPNANH